MIIDFSKDYPILTHTSNAIDRNANGSRGAEIDALEKAEIRIEMKSDLSRTVSRRHSEMP